MGFKDAITTCFGKYITFSGRARRPEYWYFVLFIFLGAVVLSFIDTLLFGPRSTEDYGGGPLTSIFQLATFIPLLAVGWRRMHDTGRPGWYLLLPLAVSLVAMLLLAVGIFGMASMMTGQHGPAAMGAGAGAFALFGLLQFFAMILMIWWLTRPSQKGKNAYGPEPRVH